MTGDARARALVERWQSQRDARARAELVVAYQGLVGKLVRRYPGTRANVDDAMQEGAVGLLIAIDRFDASRGASFATYATLWIRSYLLDFARRTQQVQRLTGRAGRKLFFSLGRHARELARQGREATPEAIAELEGTSVDVVHGVLACVQYRDVELDAVALGGARAVDSFASFDPGADELLDRARETRAGSLLLARAMQELTERERVVVRRRRLEDKPAPLRTIGAELGLSGERVRQIEARALERIATFIRRARTTARAA